MNIRTLPEYETPPGTVCTLCGEPCRVVPLQNEFGYSGTHCTHGRAGTHYPSDWGSPVSDCCDADVEQGKCPGCGSEAVIAGHHEGDGYAPECDYLECEDCGHQWGNQ